MVIKVQRNLGSGLDDQATEADGGSPGTKYGKPEVVPATIR
jgi:hypothetical protein